MPGDAYGWHSRPYHKVLYCGEGSITFHTREGDFELKATASTFPREWIARQRWRIGMSLHRGAALTGVPKMPRVDSIDFEEKWSCEALRLRRIVIQSWLRKEGQE